MRELIRGNKRQFLAIKNQIKDKEAAYTQAKILREQIEVLHKQAYRALLANKKNRYRSILQEIESLEAQLSVAEERSNTIIPIKSVRTQTIINIPLPSAHPYRDTQKEITKSTSISKRVGVLKLFFSNGFSQICTAQLVDRRIVSTASHCFIHPREPRKVKLVAAVYYPEVIRGKRNIHGPQIAKRAWINKKYYNDNLKQYQLIAAAKTKQLKQQLTAFQNTELPVNDIGFLELENRKNYLPDAQYEYIGDKLGWFGLGIAMRANTVGAENTITGITAGYPGNRRLDRAIRKGDGTETLWQQTCKNTVAAFGPMLFGKCRGYLGQSGSAFLTNENGPGEHYVVAIFSAFLGHKSDVATTVFAAITSSIIEGFIAIRDFGAKAQPKNFLKVELAYPSI